MSGTKKYLGLLVSIAFVVGQVQYAYAAYYCTMIHRQVDSQSEIAVSPEGRVSDQTCVLCDCTATTSRAQEKYEPDCVRVTVGHKDVVGNFQEPSVPNLIPSGSSAVLQANIQTPSPALHSTRVVSSLISSSPGISALNNNLRI